MDVNFPDRVLKRDLLAFGLKFDLHPRSLTAKPSEKMMGKGRQSFPFWVSVTFQGQILNFGICRSNNTPPHLYPYGIPILFPYEMEVPRAISYAGTLRTAGTCPQGTWYNWIGASVISRDNWVYP